MAKTRKVRSSKKNVFGPLKKGELINLGYSTTKSATSRHRALNKSVKKYGALKTFRKLNAVATLNKNRAPTTAKVFRRDRDWVNKKYIKSTRKKGGKRGIFGRAAWTGVKMAPKAASAAWKGTKATYRTLNTVGNVGKDVRRGLTPKKIAEKRRKEIRKTEQSLKKYGTSLVGLAKPVGSFAMGEAKRIQKAQSKAHHIR